MRFFFVYRLLLMLSIKFDLIRSRLRNQWIETRKKLCQCGKMIACKAKAARFIFIHRILSLNRSLNNQSMGHSPSRFSLSIYLSFTRQWLPRIANPKSPRSDFTHDGDAIMMKCVRDEIFSVFTSTSSSSSSKNKRWLDGSTNFEHKRGESESNLWPKPICIFAGQI